MDNTPSDAEQQAFETKWEGRFDQLTGKAKEIWGDAVDDPARQAAGNVQQFIGKLKERTGETWEDIQQKLDQ